MKYIILYVSMYLFMYVNRWMKYQFGVETKLDTRTCIFANSASRSVWLRCKINYTFIFALSVLVSKKTSTSNLQLSSYACRVEMCNFFKFTDQRYFTICISMCISFMYTLKLYLLWNQPHSLDSMATSDYKWAT